MGLKICGARLGTSRKKTRFLESYEKFDIIRGASRKSENTFVNQLSIRFHKSFLRFSRRASEDHGTPQNTCYSTLEFNSHSPLGVAKRRIPYDRYRNVQKISRSVSPGVRVSVFPDRIPYIFPLEDHPLAARREPSEPEGLMRTVQGYLAHKKLPPPS